MKKQARYGSMILALCLGLHLNANAQDVEYGVKAGVLYNMPSYGNKAVSNSDAKFGMQAGVFARTSDRLYLQGELTFSMFKSTYTLQQKHYDPTFYELNVPIQLGYKIVEIDQMSLRASLGSQINYNLKKNDAANNKNFNTLTYDGILNIGTDINRFTVDLRYNQSVNKTSKELDSRNRIVGLSIGYKF
ncbi:porin family protein [Sphingobacterium pedocola]|uniref:PorT family protein n=1 Tax=Sphingobacterium pedocola TaxID=2082722 RepID=A0ABR9T7Q7_9SPHI|nr:porin family protein [Sphingobacterium pedocola]MBE8720909.1 PorT family protein [Sphingobacterium pedocola]